MFYPTRQLFERMSQCDIGTTHNINILDEIRLKLSKIEKLKLKRDKTYEVDITTFF